MDSDHTFIDVDYYFSVDMGSATDFRVTPSISVPDCYSESYDIVTHAFTANDTVEGSFYVILEGYFDPDSGATLILTGKYKENGEEKTVTLRSPLSLYEY